MYFFGALMIILSGVNSAVSSLLQLDPASAEIVKGLDSIDNSVTFVGGVLLIGLARVRDAVKEACNHILKWIPIKKSEKGT